ncbi:hypothetical protein F0562_022218 [Nyssa sinensis]|uniref:Uncharacterized protein n=1 Tax=Nyssa sinensis TaxID=561372 RepID=A0A5J5BN93_9ASTE|nr:hypothetical protein F0562_022218 [Nyssa sinensis]
MGLIKRAIHQTDGQDGAQKVKVPEPKAFNGARSAKDLENFLCGIWSRTLMLPIFLMVKHIGTMSEYVKAFSSLMLDVNNVFKEDRLFNFMSGLQGWAQVELQRQGVRDLPNAIAATNSLVDLSLDKSISTIGKPKKFDKSSGKAKDGGTDWTRARQRQQLKGSIQATSFTKGHTVYETVHQGKRLL